MFFDSPSLVLNPQQMIVDRLFKEKCDIAVRAKCWGKLRKKNKVKI